MSDTTALIHVWEATSADVEVRTEFNAVIVGSPEYRIAYVGPPDGTGRRAILDALITQATAARDQLDGAVTR